MDALCIFENDIHQMAAELRPSAALSFSLNWIGNTEKEILIDVTRTDDFGIHRWNPLRLLVGNRMSLITMRTNKIDDPIESLTAEQQENLQKCKPMMRPARTARALPRKIGILDCQINNAPLFSFHLSTENMLNVDFVWIGDKTGMCMLHLFLDGASTKSRIPKMKFGDEATFRITDRS